MAKNVLYTDEEQYKFLNIGNWDLRYLRLLRSYHLLTGESLPLLYKFPCTFLQQTSTGPLIEYQNMRIDNSNFQNVLPMAVRYIDSSGNYYVERPPFKISIDYKNAKAYEHYPKEFVNSSSGLEMWIPWTIMVIPSHFANTYDVSSVKLYFSHKSLGSMSDSYLKMFLPNSYSDSRICMSASFDHVVGLSNDYNMGKAFDLRYWHSLILNDYMLGGWNSDLDSNLFRKLTTLDFESKILVKILQKYPMLNSYVNIKNFADILDRAVNVCQTYFGCTKKRSKDIMCGAKKRKLEYKDSYVKFFCYVSSLSLEDTLSFYEQIQSFLNEVNEANYSSKVFNEIVFEARALCHSGVNLLQVQIPIADYAGHVARNPSSTDGLVSDAYSVKSVYIYFDNYSSNFLNKKGVSINSGNILYDPIEMLDYIGVDIAYLISTIKNHSLSCDINPAYPKSAYFFKVDVDLKTIVAVSVDEIKLVLKNIALSIAGYVEKEKVIFAQSRKKSGKTEVQISNFQDVAYFNDLKTIKELFAI